MAAFTWQSRPLPTPPPRRQYAECGKDEFRAIGDNTARIFVVQKKKRTMSSRWQCGYTDIHEGSTSTLGKGFDFFAAD